jgi:hypothetical protein
MHSPCHVSVKQAFLATHFASAGLSGRCCSPGTASYLADSQGLTGYLVYPEGLPVQMDSLSIPSDSFHGAHMAITTSTRPTRLEAHTPEIACSALRLFRGIPPIFPICRSINQYVHLCTLDTECSEAASPQGRWIQCASLPHVSGRALHSDALLQGAQPDPAPPPLTQQRRKYNVCFEGSHASSIHSGMANVRRGMEYVTAGGVP